MRLVFWSVIAVCLLFACITDCKTCQVYNFTWWFSGTAALLLLVTGEKPVSLENIAGLGLFLILQLKFFSKMYGRADCYAFCVCAAAETAAGMGLAEYLLHMLAAFFLLSVVQGARRNIAGNGNLKHPVPFLPYITLAFWALLWYHYSC